MRRRFVGGSLDGVVHEGVQGGAAEFVIAIPRLQSMTAARASELLSMDAADRPPPPVDIEFYERSLEHQDGKLIGFIYTHVRTETRTEAP